MEPEKFLGKDVPEEVIIEFVDKMKVPDYEWLPPSMMARARQLGQCIGPIWNCHHFPCFNDVAWMANILLVMVGHLWLGTIGHSAKK